MIEKPFDSIEKTDIEALQANAVPEGRSIDYKRTLPGNTDSEKKEFLADASSFANAAGGDLIFGVVEDEGVPVHIPGLGGIDPDKEILRLEETVRTGVDPRIPGVQSKAIEGFAEGPVIVLRVPNSWASPHMVTFKGTSRFFTRCSAGKYPMDVTEIRAAFALAEGVPKRIQAFRDDRLGKIMAGSTPVPLEPKPVLVVHLLPVSSFSSEIVIDQGDLDSNLVHLRPIGSSGWNNRFNLDGVVTFSPPRGDESRSRDYCQIFRSGRIESAYADIIRERDGTGWIASVAYEQDIIRAIDSYLDSLKALEVPLPIVCLVSMVGVKGARMWTRSGMVWRGAVPIDRDVLVLPDVVFESYDDKALRILRPVFDAVWNACGYQRSFNYDEDGNWIAT